MEPRGLHLSGAMLAGADMRRADLTGAILDEADLTSASFLGATITTSGFSDAIFKKTVCADGTSSDDDGGSCDGHGI